VEYRAAKPLLVTFSVPMTKGRKSMMTNPVGRIVSTQRGAPDRRAATEITLLFDRTVTTVTRLRLGISNIEHGMMKSEVRQRNG
jgi:hypothetical protein